ncbi:MAG: DNA polymerase II large subunit, partial [archaeon]
LYARQYKMSENEIRHVVRNCAVCIDGDGTENVEVSIYKNLERVETNRIRGGMGLVITEGIGLKAKKMLKFTKENGIDWSWLEGLIKMPKVDSQTQEKSDDSSAKYLNEIVGGRPIFCYSGKVGGFRLRYGRARNTGINAKAIHPATMYILKEFIAIGTQLKIEKPGKSCTTVSCDGLEPPIVLLKNGDVVKVDSVSKAQEYAQGDEIDKILFLGDILICYGDFLKANQELLPSGMCEEWWEQIAEQKGLDKNPSLEKAVEYSRSGVPLHPKYLHFYENLDKNEVITLAKALRKAGFESYENLSGKIEKRAVLEGKEIKRILEKACIPHKYRDGRIIIEDESLYFVFGLDREVNFEEIEKECTSGLDALRKISGMNIIEKAPTYIGARMGRPEKAKERKMSPPCHGLIPLGLFGGKTRDLKKAAEKGKIVADALFTYCEKCGKEIFAYRCPVCGERAKIRRVCEKCGKITYQEFCCNMETKPWHKKIVDCEQLVKYCEEKFGPIPGMIKGVQGTINEEKYFEPVEKAALRAKYNLYVFKDGTVRFDATNLPLTHFKPKEAGVSIDVLKKLGYTEDIFGKSLENEDQILELYPQDIIIPRKMAKYLLNCTKFIDEELEKIYGLEKFYKCEKEEDLIGHLVFMLAPHISVASLCRIIGITDVSGVYAHPYLFCATRRDADGDENAIFLVLDAYLNFSRKYLPQKRGGTMDAPMVASTVLNPQEVDDQVHDMDIGERYPLEFYEKTWEKVNPSVITNIPKVKDFLGTEKQYYGFKFTMDSSDINLGPKVTKYVQLKTMEEKVDAQLSIGEKIIAVDIKDAAARILNFHFLKDIHGNLRSFGEQTVRCVDCNEKYRRVPLVKKCTKCGGKLLLTVGKGNIEKYLDISKNIAEKYGLSEYLKQRLKLIENTLNTVFKETKIELEKQEEKIIQKSLADFI